MKVGGGGAGWSSVILKETPEKVPECYYVGVSHISFRSYEIRFL